MRCLSKIKDGKVRHVYKSGAVCMRSKATVSRHNRLHKSKKTGMYSRKKHIKAIYKDLSNRAQRMREMRARRMGRMA